MVRRKLATGVVALCIGLAAQTPEFVSSLNQVRSLASTVRKLQEQTGWHICVEEPLLPKKSAPGRSTRTSFHGNRVAPPDPDMLQVRIDTLGAAADRPAAIRSLLTAFNDQNRSVTYKAETMGSYTVLEADTLTDAFGQRSPAALILDNTVLVTAAQRTPTGHLQALADAIQHAVGNTVLVDLDTDNLDIGFTGKMLAMVPTPENPRPGRVFNFEWGMAAPASARMALVDLLSHSLTTYDWSVYLPDRSGRSRGMYSCPATTERSDDGCIRQGQGADRDV